MPIIPGIGRLRTRVPGYLRPYSDSLLQNTQSQTKQAAQRMTDRETTTYSRILSTGGLFSILQEERVGNERGDVEGAVRSWSD